MLQEIPILDTCTVCVCMDECEVTSDLDMSKQAEDDNEELDRRPADTDNVDL